MTTGRMRRLAASMTIGLAFSACAGGDRLDKADAPQTGQTAPTGGSSDTSLPAAGTFGEDRADFGLADVAAALGLATPVTPGGTATAPGGDPSAAGGAPAAGGSVLPGGVPGAGAPLAPGGAANGGAAAPAPSGGADTGSGSAGAAPGGAPGGGSGSGGSGSAGPKIAATPEECALLRQLMAIVDHPQLHQLRADTGC